jgi:hypothetical protein
LANTDTKTSRTNKTLLDSTGKPALATAEMTAKAADAAASTTENTASAARSAAENTASAARSVADAAFQMPQFEVPEAFRSMAEQTLTQTREAYSRMRDATSEATDLMEESLETTRDSLRDVQFKALDAAKNNADATFDFMRKLLSYLGIRRRPDPEHLRPRAPRGPGGLFQGRPDRHDQGDDRAAKPARALFDRALSQSKAA